MLKRKDLMILQHLRKDSRSRLTAISRRTHIPVTTIYDNIKRYEKDFIIKNSCLLDFRKIGMSKASVLLKAENAAALIPYLKEHASVNSVYRCNGAYNLLAEVVVQELRELDEFCEGLKGFGVNELLVLNIIDEPLREEFLSKP